MKTGCLQPGRSFHSNTKASFLSYLCNHLWCEGNAPPRNGWFSHLDNGLILCTLHPAATQMWQKKREIFLASSVCATFCLQRALSQHGSERTILLITTKRKVSRSETGRDGSRVTQFVHSRKIHLSPTFYSSRFWRQKLASTVTHLLDLCKCTLSRTEGCIFLK